MSKVFAETSVHIQRFLSKGPEQEALITQCASLAPDLCTSSYVWMKFQRTLGDDFAHIQGLMARYSNWDSLLFHMLDGQRAFRPRSAARCTRLVGLIYEQCEGDWSYAKYIIDNELKFGLKSRFWTNVTPLSDPIVCDLVTEGIAFLENGTFTVANSCRKETASCYLPDFLTAQCDRLQAIADYLAAHPKCIKQQSRVEQHLAKVIEESQAVLGQGTCWPLGDIIIALQVPEDAQLWTLDADFEALAEALSLRLYSAKGIQ